MMRALSGGQAAHRCSPVQCLGRGPKRTQLGNGVTTWVHFMMFQLAFTPLMLDKGVLWGLV